MKGPFAISRAAVILGGLLGGMTRREWGSDASFLAGMRSGEGAHPKRQDVVRRAQFSGRGLRAEDGYHQNRKGTITNAFRNAQRKQLRAMGRRQWIIAKKAQRRALKEQDRG